MAKVKPKKNKKATPTENAVHQVKKAKKKNNKKNKKVAKANVETSAPEIYDQEGTLIFSKFELDAPPLTSTEDDKTGKKKKKVVGSKSKKGLQQLLKKAEKNELTIRELEGAGKSDEALQLKSQAQWRNAFAKCEGVKVRDRPELIKKSIKRLDKTKKKSAKKWQERLKTVEEKKKSRVDKRDRNINKRKTHKKESHNKRMKKQGRIGKL